MLTVAAVSLEGVPLDDALRLRWFWDLTVVASRMERGAFEFRAVYRREGEYDDGKSITMSLKKGNDEGQGETD